jgi:hypothetical protein
MKMEQITLPPFWGERVAHVESLLPGPGWADIDGLQDNVERPSSGMFGQRLIEILEVYLCTSQSSKKRGWQSKLDCSLAGSSEAAHLGLGAEMQPHAGIEAG